MNRWLSFYGLVPAFLLLLWSPCRSEVKVSSLPSSGIMLEFSLSEPGPGNLFFDGCGTNPDTREPFHFASVGIPADAVLGIRIQKIEWAEIPGAISSLDFPSAGTCRITETGWVRSQRIAGIAFYPFRKSAGKSFYAKRAWVEVFWKNAGAAKSLSRSTEEPLLFEKQLQNSVVNYAQAKLWRKQTGVPLAKSLQSGTPGQVRAKFFVSKEGMQRISYQKLKELGVNPDRINPNTFRIFNMGKEVPLWVEGNSDGRFDPQDGILFFGTFTHGNKSYFSQYTYTNIYWLSWDGPLGLRYASQSVSPRYDLRSNNYLQKNAPQSGSFLDTVHIEIDKEVRFLGTVAAPVDAPVDTVVSQNEDLWIWDYIGYRDETSFEFFLPSPGAGGEAVLRVNLIGLSSIDSIDPDHSLRLILNESQIPELIEWDGKAEYTFQSRPFQNSWLAGGRIRANFIKEVAHSLDASALNWFEVIYWRAPIVENNACRFKSGADALRGVYEFNLSGFTNRNISLWDLDGRKLEGFLTDSRGDSSFSITFHDSLDRRINYLALTSDKFLSPDNVVLDTASDLRSSQNRADVILLTHSLFKDSLSALVQLRESQGLRVKVVDVEEVYNEFNYGVMDPVAIKDFLRHAVAQWSRPAPSVLLIIGDTSHDFDKKSSELNFVPTYLSTVPRWGPASDDDWFTTVCGEDVFPDLIVGRIPVSTNKDLREVISKIVSNEKQLLYREWRDKFLLIGGTETRFARINDHFAQNVIREKYHQIRLDMRFDSPYFYSGESHSRLVNALDGGVSLVCFSGHGGGNVWSDGDIFNLDDVKQMHNSDKLPAVFSFTCLTGFFESATFPSLGENMLRLPDRGALAFYGASAYVSLAADEKLSEELLTDIVANHPATVGEITYRAELNTLLKYGAQNVSITRQYNLLGDPLSSMKYPADDLRISCPNPHTTGAESLVVSCKSPRFSHGYAKVGIYNGLSLLESKTVEFGSDSFTVAFRQKPGASIADGFVRAYAWADTTDSRGVLPYTHNALQMGGVSFSKSELRSGDTAGVFMVIKGHRADTAEKVYCYYGTGARSNLVSFTDSVEMLPANDTLFQSKGPIHIQQASDAESKLWIKFKLFGDSAVLESNAKMFGLKKLPDLAPTVTKPIYTFGVDTLKAMVRAINVGLDTATGTKAKLFFGTDTGSLTEVGQQSFSQKIAPGKMDSAVFVLPDFQGQKWLRVKLNPDTAVIESDRSNNQADLRIKLSRARLSSATDTLYGPDSNMAVRPLNVTPLTLTISESDTSARSPAIQGMVFCVLKNTSAGPVYQVESSPDHRDSLAELFFHIDSVRTQSRVSALLLDDTLTTDYLGVYKWSDSLDRWIWQGGERSRNRLSLKVSGFSEYCAGIRLDDAPPTVEISSNGRPVVYTDYVPIGHTLDFFIKDDAGVNISTFELRVNGEVPDTSHLQVSYSGSSPKILIANYLPSRQRTVDSLTIRVADVNGNYSEKTLTYQLGEELSIRFLANYPNPFRENTLITFTVTDICKEASFQIYTIAGRPVRSWNLIDEFGDNLIGYHELEWDCRDKDGYKVANGTYYLKMTIKGENGAKREKIAQMVRLMGY